MVIKQGLLRWWFVVDYKIVANATLQDTTHIRHVPEMIPWCEFLSLPKQSLFWKRFRLCTWSSRSFLPGGRLLWPSDLPSVSSHLEPQTSQGKGRPTLRKNENCLFWTEFPELSGHSGNGGIGSLRGRFQLSDGPGAQVRIAIQKQCPNK